MKNFKLCDMQCCFQQENIEHSASRSILAIFELLKIFIKNLWKKFVYII
jgi:hypothetical protein